MGERDVIIIAVAVIAVLFLAVVVVVCYRIKIKKILSNLETMLDQAMNGSFTENRFDESMLSAIETRMMHYLEASEVSARNLENEKKKIKELIGDISHQTKTPIANLLLYAELLQERELSADNRKLVKELVGQAEKLSFLIQTLVKTSRLETGIFVLHPQENEIKELVEAVTEQAVYKAEEKDISIIVGDLKGYAIFDKKWTVEALYNIVDNAVKYTESGGWIKVRAVSYEMFCRIDIIDNGIGIPEAEQAKIFKRFYRGKSVSEEEGVGIGLYLSREIISGQNGYIKVISRRGKGTTFSVFLPSEQ